MLRVSSFMFPRSHEVSNPSFNIHCTAFGFVILVPDESVISSSGLEVPVIWCSRSRLLIKAEVDVAALIP
ncbi:hypothetical protein L195_g061501 [Trifolium pratense]|uniref:Uncharacterized protein n=1 Tax=Trifolium pratense TaxID=57577 RepID=A0A2K3KA80_TRIPR|nr:hypothetical protein L195_g061501 [Trifolium pratense]